MNDDNTPPRPGTHADGGDLPLAVPVGHARPVVSPLEPLPDRGPMYLLQASRGTCWADLAILVVLLMVSDVVLVTIADIALRKVAEADDRLLQLILLPFRALAWTCVVALLLYARQQGAASVGCTRLNLRSNIPLGLVSMAAAFAAFWLLAILVGVLWPDGFAKMQGNQDAITRMLPPLPVPLIAVQVIVGFYEELIFRGFLLTRLRRATGSWLVAVLLSSALFAVLHITDQVPVAAIPLFGIGVVFALFTIWRKSLVPAMIGHALFNALNIAGIFITNPDWT